MDSEKTTLDSNEPQKRSRSVVVDYWSCGLDEDGHYHNSRETALACINRRKAQAFARDALGLADSEKAAWLNAGRPAKRWTPEDYLEILDRDGKGESASDIAAGYGYTTQYIKSKIDKARLMRKHGII